MNGKTTLIPWLCALGSILIASFAWLARSMHMALVLSVHNISVHSRTILRLNHFSHTHSGLLVHRRVRTLQGSWLRWRQGLRSRFVVVVRWAVARAERQARAATLRASQHCGPDLPGPRVPANLLCGRKFRGRQGEVPSLGRHHVASIRGAIQPTHRARRGLGFGRQTGHARRANEHRTAPSHQRYRETEESCVLGETRLFRCRRLHPPPTHIRLYWWMCVCDSRLTEDI